MLLGLRKTQDFLHSEAELAFGEEVLRLCHVVAELSRSGFFELLRGDNPAEREVFALCGCQVAKESRIH